MSRHGEPQSVNVESVVDEKSFTDTLADTYLNNPRLADVHKRVKQTLIEKGLL